MPTIHFILQDGSTRAVEAEAGASLMETAIRANVRGIDAECGGLCSCATCHVYVAEACIARLPAPDGEEEAMLDFVAAERRPGSRLSCQIQLTEALEGLTVQVPPTQS
ncbi:2Fe-2S iron-sulfur cluster binding domain-containing protein [Xylophilus rhododendri]|uniref:2Fe-2S iron-sulfur cluster binding domain-containing protein n=1 Tax=Xylophilus rhododendri TaxID=2697032 RepID=A0A857J447_9BURK|nr:2Fe-2S iron-sulfur cluster-binding protein [Xylophilus rhododendri]QHI97635.1 2Fe-2S iron-sulfur cluster binding domain-containing protein [Xylophilus rhododendri]